MSRMIIKQHLVIEDLLKNIKEIKPSKNFRRNFWKIANKKKRKDMISKQS